MTINCFIHPNYKQAEYAVRCWTKSLKSLTDGHITAIIKPAFNEQGTILIGYTAKLFVKDSCLQLIDNKVKLCWVDDQHNIFHSFAEWHKHKPIL